MRISDWSSDVCSSDLGLVNMVIAAWIALFKDDLKGLLAHSTVSHLGLVTMLFGFGTPIAAVAGVFHILNHATFKRSEEHTSELQSLMRISYAVFCLKKKKN